MLLATYTHVDFDGANAQAAHVSREAVHALRRPGEHDEHAWSGALGLVPLVAARWCAGPRPWPVKLVELWETSILPHLRASIRALCERSPRRACARPWRVAMPRWLRTARCPRRWRPSRVSLEACGHSMVPSPALAPWVLAPDGCPPALPSMACGVRHARGLGVCAAIGGRNGAGPHSCQGLGIVQDMRVRCAGGGSVRASGGPLSMRMPMSVCTTSV